MRVPPALPLLLAAAACRDGTGPPETTGVRVPVTRDTWVSAYAGEEERNYGGAARLKTKGIQELAILDIDAARLKGRVIEGAALHVRVQGDEVQRRVTVSTLSAPWKEREATFRGPWGEKRRDLTSVFGGLGNTLWGFADATPPQGGWQAIAVDRRVVAARVAGLSHGFVVMDDVGTEYTRRGDAIEVRIFPNRYVFSREAGPSRAPFFSIRLGAKDTTPPGPVGAITATPEGAIRWTSPQGALGFHVRYARAGLTGWKAATPVPRHLVPLAGGDVKMRLRLEGEYVIGVRAVDAAGNVGPLSTGKVRLARPRPLKLGEPPVEPVAGRGPNPEVGKVEVSVLDSLEKEGRPTASHLWSGAQRKVRLFAARNEFVSFVVGLDGEGEEIRAEFRPVSGPGARLYALRNIPTARGALPDPVVPLEQPLRAPAKLLVEIYVPHDAKPGLHGGVLRLNDLEIAVQLRVWSFTLPDHLSFVPQMNCYQLPRNERDYYRLAHEHRTCLNRLPYNWRGEVVAGFVPDDGDWSEHDRRFGPLFDGSLFDDLPRQGVAVDAFYLPLNENWPASIEEGFKGGYWADAALTPAYRKRFVAGCRAFATHIGERGWNDTIFEFYLNNKLQHKRGKWGNGSAPWTFDEPVNTQDFFALRWFGRAFHEGVKEARAHGKLAFRCDVSRPQWQRDLLDGLLDVNVVGAAFRDYRPMVLARKRRFGEIAYVYGTTNKVEAPNTMPARWCLEAWCHGLDGVLPWQTVGNRKSFEKDDPLAVFYPGPLASLRLKAYRRGQQDVEYLVLLAAALGRSREDVGRAALARLGSPTPESLWKLRTSVGRMLDELRPPARRRVVDLRPRTRDPGRIPLRRPVALRR